jgi:hypothetical protein
MKAIVALFGLSLVVCSNAFADAPKQSGQVTYQYEQPEATEFYRKVLEAMEIPYSSETHEGRPVYWWLPRDPAQDAEVRGRVSQFMFATANCPRDRWPTPSTPANTIKVCEK